MKLIKSSLYSPKIFLLFPKFKKHLAFHDTDAYLIKLDRNLTSQFINLSVILSCDDRFFVTSFNLIRIDTTAPAGVTLSYPVDTLDSGSFPHTFSWSINSTNKGSDITDTLLIASDSSMKNILLDTTFLSATSISLDTIHSAVSGKLYWKINRGDAAGNSNTKVSAKEFWIK